MIVDSERTIALTCPACQIIQEHTFSLFSISQQPFQLLCRCGFSQGHLRRQKGRFELNMLGADGERVRIPFSRSEFISRPLVKVFSGSKERKLGFLGSPQAVQKAMLEESTSFTLEVGNFSNPEIMREVLKLLQDLAERDKIRCECEHSSIGIDVYSDLVELVCSYCGSMVQIGASSRRHQERLSSVAEIVMEPCTSQFLEEWLKPLT